MTKFQPNARPLWYLVPFFLAMIGGLIGYIGTRNRDHNMAINMLLIGAATTIIYVFIYRVLITLPL